MAGNASAVGAVAHAEMRTRTQHVTRASFLVLVVLVGLVVLVVAAAVAGAAFACATTLTTGVGTVASGFIWLRAASSSGLPRFALRCSRCAANETGAAGGAVRATTGRSNARAGGLPRAAAEPRTLCS